MPRQNSGKYFIHEYFNLKKKKESYLKSGVSLNSAYLACSTRLDSNPQNWEMEIAKVHAFKHRTHAKRFKTYKIHIY